MVEYDTGPWLVLVVLVENPNQYEVRQLNSCGVSAFCTDVLIPLQGHSNYSTDAVRILLSSLGMPYIGCCLTYIWGIFIYLSAPPPYLSLPSLV